MGRPKSYNFKFFDRNMLTSQRCSACGATFEKSRNGEKFICVVCGHSEDADLNASKNILHRGVYNPSTLKTDQ